MRLLILVLALALGALAQHHSLSPAALGTAEGPALQQIRDKPDGTQKLALAKEFSEKYPKHEGLPWVYDVMVASYAKLGQNDEVIATGEKLIALDPLDVETAYACLQAAEAKKDTALTMKWSATTSEMAKKVAAMPKPDAPGEAEDWARAVDWAKQVDVRAEYSLFATMLQVPDPKVKLQLADALEARNPQSPYLAQMAEQRFQAYTQAGDNAKAVALAEKLVESGRATPEMYLGAANGAMAKKNVDQAITYSKKAIEAAEAKEKPESMADTEWENWKTQITSRAHWMEGMTYAGQNQWSAADQELRAALPGIQENSAMLAEALFYAGLANYRLAEAGNHERARDALKFSNECAAIPGPFQDRARKNATAIRSQYHIR